MTTQTTPQTNTTKTPKQRVRISCLTKEDATDPLVNTSVVDDLMPNTTDELKNMLNITGMLLPASAAESTVPESPLQVPYSAGMTLEIALQEIDENPFNARVYYSSQDVDDMALQLRQNGQLVPAIGYLKEHRIVLTDGQKRLRGARAAGLKTLQVSLKEPPSSPLENYLESRSINLFRSSQTPLDDAMQWHRFLQDKVFDTQADLAKKLNVSEGLVSQTLSLNRITQRVKMNMLERPETHALATGYEISRLFGDTNKEKPEMIEQIAMDIVGEIHEKGLTSKQVRSLIDSKLAPKKTRNKPEFLQFKYGGVKGSVKVFESKGQLELSIKGLSKIQLSELQAQIERITAASSDS